MRRFLSVLISFALILCLMPLSWAGAEDSEIVLTILHTNDTHGSGIAAATEKMIRFSQIPSILEAFDQPILVDAGDFSAGTVYASLTEGMAPIYAMRLLGYDAAVLGNHEFTSQRTDFVAALTSQDEALPGQPVALVNANVTGSAEMEALPAYTLLERQNVKVGIFGLTTPSTVITASPAACAGLKFENVCVAAQRCVDDMKANGAEVIICLAHLGYNAEDEGAQGITSNAVAANVSGIDVIVDGHAHQSLMAGDAITVNDTLIVSSGTAMANVGVVELVLDAQTHAVKAKESGAIPAADAYSTFPDADSEVRAYLDQVVEEVNAKAGTVFASISMALYGGNYTNGERTASIARRGETNANAMMADAKLEAAKEFFAGSEYEDLPIVALLCGGSCRSTIHAGEVANKDVMSLFLSGGAGSSGLYVKTTGAVLWETIEWGLSALTGQDTETGEITANGSYHGRFPNLAGVSYVYDLRKEPSTPINYTDGEYRMGSRLVGVTLADGTPITPDSDLELILCTSSYELGGGDSYYCLAAAEQAGKLTQIGSATVSAFEATVAYMEKLYKETGDVYYPLCSGRVTALGDYDKETFTSTVLVLNADNMALAGQEVEFFVNYGRPEGAEWVSMGKFVTDDQGEFEIQMRNGPQETRVEAGGKTSAIQYVNNYAGLVNNTLVLDVH